MCCGVDDGVSESFGCELRCCYDSNLGLNVMEAQAPRKHISRPIS